MQSPSRHGSLLGKEARACCEWLRGEARGGGARFGAAPDKGLGVISDHIARASCGFYANAAKPGQNMPFTSDKEMRCANPQRNPLPRQARAGQAALHAPWGGFAPDPGRQKEGLGLHRQNGSGGTPILVVAGLSFLETQGISTHEASPLRDSVHGPCSHVCKRWHVLPVYLYG
jgi:hypothetical protein